MSKHFAPYVPISMGPLCAKVNKTISLNLFFKGYLVMLLSQENQGIQALFSQKNKKDGAFNKSIVQEVIWEEICPRLVWRVDRVNNLQLSFRYNERPNFWLISIRHFTMGNLRNHQFQYNEQRQKVSQTAMKVREPKRCNLHACSRIN